MTENIICSGTRIKMKKNKRFIAVLTALVLGLASAASCCRKETSGSDTRTESPSDSKTEKPSETKTETPVPSNDTASESTPEESEPGTSEVPTSMEPEPSSPEAPVKPTEPAGSKLHQAYDLFYPLPDWILAMKYNGMMGVYEFYTGDFNGSPTGLDFAVEVYSDEELNGETLETYVLTRSRAKKAGLTAIEHVNYNGYDWLRLTNGADATYYYAVFNEGLYCLLALQNADTAENYLTARDMLEQTLFFEIAE